MDMKKQLEEIWNNENTIGLPERIKERGHLHAINEKNKDILITGINPSYRINNDRLNKRNYDFKTFKTLKYDNYWSPIKKMLISDSIDIFDKTAYLDIFYFREKEQNCLEKEILPSPNGIQFIARQLNITQHTIEDIIKPKLIIVKNKESAAYWGKLSNKGLIWMGYDLEAVTEEEFRTIIKDENIDFRQYGELYRIKGLIHSEERISPEIKETVLKGSLILFTTHINQYTKREKRPTPDFIKNIYEYINEQLN